MQYHLSRWLVGYYRWSVVKYHQELADHSWRFARIYYQQQKFGCLFICLSNNIGILLYLLTINIPLDHWFNPCNCSRTSDGLLSAIVGRSRYHDELMSTLWVLAAAATGAIIGLTRVHQQTRSDRPLCEGKAIEFSREKFLGRSLLIKQLQNVRMAR